MRPLALALVLLGCSSDAEQKCQEFQSALCDRIASCSSTSKESCMAEFAKRSDCRNARDVPADFEKSCLPAIKNVACSGLTALPDACDIRLGD